MSIFVDQSPGADTGNVTMDLFTISWNDSNLGQGPDTTITGGLSGITSIPVAPATYVGGVTTGMATANRLLQLITTSTTLSWGNPIVITGLFGGIDPYSQLDVTGNGFTYVDTNVVPNVIHIAYDTSQANGQGLALYDTNGDPIQSPNAVILYHEMSHAFHNAINQIPFPQNACPGNGTDEPAAEIDENVLRSQLGLCLRDVCNHGGEIGWGKACGGRATPTGPILVDGTTPPPCDCFIVTAVTGSARAPDLVTMRAIRATLAARSTIAASLIGAIYDEYFRFSIGIAARIAARDDTRRTVADLVVGPLFAWFRLADQLTRDASDRDAIERLVEEADHAGRGIAGLAPLLRDATRGAIDPALLAFAPELRHLDDLPRLRWALIDPLVAIATVATRADLVAAIADWLGAAPVERLATTDDWHDDDIAALAALFDFAPTARHRLGTRLAVRWPDRRAALAHHDFLS